MKKKNAVIAICVIFFIIAIFFIIFNYKNFKIGNNESNKSVEEVQKYILNINSYKATLDVTINTNKNTNKYILKQEVKLGEYEKQTVIKPENIEGTEISYKNGNLEINNTKLNLSKMYTNYPYITENILWLNSFSNDCKNNLDKVKVYEENECVIMELKNIDNQYCYTKKLYLEKGTGKPIKFIVQDNNKKDLIYILYTEIEINK